MAIRISHTAILSISMVGLKKNENENLYTYNLSILAKKISLNIQLWLRGKDTRGGVWRELLRPLLCAAAATAYKHELPMLFSVFLSLPPSPPKLQQTRSSSRTTWCSPIQYIYTQNRSRRYMYTLYSNALVH